MRANEIFTEGFLDNDPEWDLVTLIDTFKAQKGINQIPFSEFLRSAQDQGYDVDAEWLEEFLERQKQTGLIFDFSKDENYINVDETDPDKDAPEDKKKADVADAADSGKDEEEKKKDKVSSMAKNTIKKSIKDK